MKLNRVSLAFCLAAFSLQPSESPAQQVAAETCDVPVIMTGFDNELVRDLSLSDFSLHIADAAGTVDSASIDGSPKRVALVLDASRNIPKDEWKLETKMAATFVEHARPKDQFAFLVIGAEGTADSLSSSGDLAERLRSIPVPHR